MKLLIIPDVHGLDAWKAQVKDVMHMPDVKVIFLGDYVDSRGEQLTGFDIMSNLNDIIAFKKKYPEKVTLLLGNHDYAYVFGYSAITGFNYEMWETYRPIFNDNWKLFDMAWGHQGERYTLLTHAGLTHWFYGAIERAITDPEHTMHKILVDGNPGSWRDLPLHEVLNYFKDQGALMWKIGYARRGSAPSGSILWADKSELLAAPYPGIDQIVGHTSSPYAELKWLKSGEKIIFSDMHNEWDGSHRALFIELR